MRRASILGVLLVSAACGHSVTEVHVGDDDHSPQVLLSGEALEAELASSPAREAPVPFARLALLWDAPEDAMLEFQVSEDGSSWSEWRPAEVFHVEREDISSFVGRIDLESALGQYYRLRSTGPTRPTSVLIEFISETPDALEEGEPYVEEELGTVESALTIGGATVNARSVWGAKAPRCTSSHSPYRFTVHHTETGFNDSLTVPARLRQIQAFHQNNRGWCDIGYQYLVSKDGKLWEGRGATRVGSHVANNNTGNIGVSFIGSFTTNKAPDAAINAAATLIKGLAAKYKIAVGSGTVKGHRNYGGTTCPGNALYAQLPTIISRAKAASSTTPPPTPAPSNPPALPTGTATLKGVIYRGTNTSARVPNAKVTLSDGRTTTADASGVYQFTKLPAGPVTVKAEASVGSGSVQRTLVAGQVIWGSVSL